MSPQEQSELEARKQKVRERAQAANAEGKVKVVTAPADLLVGNDYGAYMKACKDAGKAPLSKVEWAEAKLKRSKAKDPRNGKPAPERVAKGILGEKDAKDVEAATTKRKEQKAKDKVAEAQTTAKKSKDPNALTVSDVAKEVGIEPKVARARLRRHGFLGSTRATDGRWPTVVRGSDEHKALRDLLAADDKKAAEGETKE